MMLIPWRTNEYYMYSICSYCVSNNELVWLIIRFKPFVYLVQHYHGLSFVYLCSFYMSARCMRTPRVLQKPTIKLIRQRRIRKNSCRRCFVVPSTVMLNNARIAQLACSLFLHPRSMTSLTPGIGRTSNHQQFTSGNASRGTARSNQEPTVIVQNSPSPRRARLNYLSVRVA